MKLNSSDQGFLDRMLAYITPNSLVEKVQLHRSYIMELALCVGAGFIVGFLVKKNSKYVFALVVVILCLIILQQLEIVTFTPHWEKINEYIGIKYITVSNGGTWEWLRQNIWLVITTTVGFLIGIRLG